MRPRWVTLVAVALLFGGATAAAANDICFLDNSGLPPLVIKNFSFPKAGQCSIVSGSFQGGEFLISGWSCGSSQIENVDFAVSIEPPMGDVRISYNFFVNRGTLTGEGALFCSPEECSAVLDIPYGSPNFSIRQVTCQPKESPVP